MGLEWDERWIYRSNEGRNGGKCFQNLGIDLGDSIVEAGTIAWDATQKIRMVEHRVGKFYLYSSEDSAFS